MENTDAYTANTVPTRVFNGRFSMLFMFNLRDNKNSNAYTRVAHIARRRFICNASRHEPTAFVLFIFVLLMRTTPCVHSHATRGSFWINAIKSAFTFVGSSTKVKNFFNLLARHYIVCTMCMACDFPPQIARIH